jgi:ABC-2 type transport system ATP-binding protein
VEKVCSHVAILKKGVLIAEGAVDTILVNEDIVELGAADMNKLSTALNSMPNHTRINPGENGKMTIQFPAGTADLASVNAHCFQSGIVLNHLQVKKKSLESKFIELTNEVRE